MLYTDRSWHSLKFTRIVPNQFQSISTSYRNIFNNLKELVISTKQTTIGNSMKDNNEMFTLLTSVLGHSTALEILNVDMVTYSAESKRCDDIVWNMPRLHTLRWISNLYPRKLVMPSLVQAEIFVIQSNDVIRILNDLPNVRSIHLSMTTNENAELAATSTSTLLSTVHEYEHKDDIVSCHGYKSIETFQCQQFPPQLIHIMYTMSALTTMDVQWSTPPSYDQLTELFGYLPLIVNINMTIYRKGPIVVTDTDIEDDFIVTSSLLSMSSLPLSHTEPFSLFPTPIRLPRLQNLNLYGWNQKFADMLICPHLNRLQVGYFVKDFDDRLAMDMVPFLSTSSKLTSLSISMPFFIYPVTFGEFVQPTLPKLSHLSFDLTHIMCSSMANLLSCSPNIQSLHVRTTWIQNELLNVLATVPSSLASLTLLCRSGNFDDDQMTALTHILSKCPQLTKLYINQTSNITPLFQRQLSQMPQLTVDYV
jgi:hypothetical protein